MSIYQQLAQQPDHESVGSDHCLLGILDLLAESADKPEPPLSLGSFPAQEQEQPSGLLGHLRAVG